MQFPTRRLTQAAALAMALLLNACASPPPATPPAFLLLGEVHDNPQGHRQRLNDLRNLLAQGWRPAIVMEQFDAAQSEKLSAAMRDCKNADCVIAKAGSGGWEWPLYRPLIELALRYQLPLAAANLSRQQLGSAMRQGINSVLDTKTMQDFGLPASLTPELYAVQREEIVAGHCGKAPASMLEGMINAQVARDVWMAKVMLEHNVRGVVLIAGNGHVRRDWGVAYWLRQRGPSDIRSVGYIENADSTEIPQFDRTVSVPPHPRSDPCEGLTLPAAR